MKNNVEAMLAQRGERYGEFAGHAAIAQDLKARMHAAEGWERLAPDQREALEMVQHKIARILNGDPSYDDNWVDIAGYAKLVADRLGKPAPTPANTVDGFCDAVEDAASRFAGPWYPDSRNWVEVPGDCMECPIDPSVWCEVLYKVERENRVFTSPMLWNELDAGELDWDMPPSHNHRIVAYTLEPLSARR